MFYFIVLGLVSLVIAYYYGDEMKRDFGYTMYYLMFIGTILFIFLCIFIDLVSGGGFY